MPWDGPLLQLQERDCLVPPSPACCSRTSWSQAAHSNRQSAGVAPSFAESTISSHLPSMLQLQLLRVDLGGLVDGYTTAGQFIQMRVGEKKAGFFAIASPPDKENRGPVEVLVKDNAPETTAHDLCRIEPGIWSSYRVLHAPACKLFMIAPGGFRRALLGSCVHHRQDPNSRWLQNSQGMCFGLCMSGSCYLK